jgi:hypothetical protein
MFFARTDGHAPFPLLANGQKNQRKEITPYVEVGQCQPLRIHFTRRQAVGCKGKDAGKRVCVAALAGMDG